MKRGIALLLLLLIFALPLGALADTVEVTGNNVNIRTGPGTGYQSLGKLAKGTQLNRTGADGDWTAVEYLGSTAYVSSGYVKTYVETADGAAGEAITGNGKVTATAAANVRKGPGTSYGKVGTLKKGAQYEVLGEADGWVNILYKGVSRFVSASYVSDGSKAASGSYVAMKKNTYVYAGPGTGYQKIIIMKKHAAIERLSESGGWTKVRLYTGKTGYVYSDHVKEVAPVDNSKVQSAGGGYMTDVAEEAIKLTNQVRAEYGLSALKTSKALTYAAEVRCNEIVKKFSHVRPDGTDCITVDPIHMSGENIGYATGSMFQNAHSVIIADGFMTSKEHFANMLSADYGTIGMAGQRVGNNTYWVQVFGP